MAGDGGKQAKTSENSGRQRETAGKTEDNGGRWVTVGDDTMPPTLIVTSYLSGKFRKRRDGTMKYWPSSSLPRTDGLPRCEHCPNPTYHDGVTPSEVRKKKSSLGEELFGIEEG